MPFLELDALSSREKEMFVSVCNHLLSNTFITRNHYKDGIAISNAEYNFLAQHFELISEYLGFAGWRVHHVLHSGYYYVSNDLEANRLTLNKKSTAVLLCLRLLYDENSERVGLNQDAAVYVRDVLEKLVTDFPILGQKPNMQELKQILRLFEGQHLIIPLDGKYLESTCSFAILPTILTAVSAEKMNSLVLQMRQEQQEEADEEIDEDPFD